MLINIYTITLLFIAGLFLGMVSVMYGVKGILKTKINAGYCGECNHPYEWYELIPVISYFLMRGKCSHCNKVLSPLLPLLEVVAGLLFAFSYIIYGFSYEMVVMIILTLLLVNVFVSDFKYYIILDKSLLLSSILVLMLKLLFFGLRTFLISICSGLIIFLLMMFIRFVGNKIFKGESLGGGDIKLAVVFGFVLGLRLGIVSLVLGSFLAFPYAVYSALSNSNREIPFGPFLITGLYLVFIFMEVVNHFLSIIF